MPNESGETSPSSTSPMKDVEGASILRDALPQAPSFSNLDTVIILCLAAVFMLLFVYLLVRGDQPLFSYWTFSALLIVIFVGILRSTGVVRTPLMVVGGGPALYIALIWFTNDSFNTYQNSAQKLAVLQRHIMELESQTDPAKDTLNHYLSFLQNKKFSEAYALVADARLRERERQFGPDHFTNFVSSFDNTSGYDNIAIAFESASGGDRKYTFSYDVTDSIPRNDLYERSKRLVSAAGTSEVFNQDGILEIIISNVRQYYVLPNDGTIEMIKSYISSRTISDLFDPLFIGALARHLRENKIDLKLAQPHPENVEIKRHFFHNIVMIQDTNGMWKIRQGLAMPVVASY